MDNKPEVQGLLIEHAAQIKMLIHVSNSLAQRLSEAEIAIKILQADAAARRTRRCNCEKHTKLD